MQIDATYTPKPVERKILFGMTLEQKRNDGKIDESLFSNIVTKRQDVSLSLFNFNLLLNCVKLLCFHNYKCIYLDNRCS